MINVLIVEDELPLLRGISALIPKINSNFNIVYCAKNGLEALEALKCHEVDLLVTDINMPIMDGLELLKIVTTEYTYLKTVIISGYSDFNYAKQAMLYGVKHYLLKPIDLTELTNLLHELEVEITENSYYLKKLYLADCLANTSTKLAPKFNENTVMLYFCLGSYHLSQTMDFQNTTILDHTQSLLKSLTYFLQPDAESFVFPEHDVLTYTLIIEVKSASKFKQSLHEFMNEFQSDIPFTFILSHKILDFSQLSKLRKKMRIHLSEQLIYAQSKVLMQDEKKKAYAIPLSDKIKLQHIIQKESTLEINNYLLHLKQNLIRYGATQKNVKATLKEVILLIQTELNCDSSLLLDDTITDLVNSYYCYDDLFTHFTELCHSITSGKVIPPKNSVQLMADVETYILTNLQHPLNTQMLADRFGLVAPYLSRLFKDYKGVSPTQYVQQLRLEQAKVLLITEPPILTKDIAESLGYANAFYFSKTFKKHVGVSPSDYREQYVNKKVKAH